MLDIVSTKSLQIWIVFFLKRTLFCSDWQLIYWQIGFIHSSLFWSQGKFNHGSCTPSMVKGKAEKTWILGMVWSHQHSPCLPLLRQRCNFFDMCDQDGKLYLEVKPLLLLTCTSSSSRPFLLLLLSIY